MSDYETAMERIAPCGLHCGKCFAFAKGDIHEAAGKLQENLGNFAPYAERFTKALDPVFENYPAFRKLLDYIADAQCGGCRKEKCKFYTNCKVSLIAFSHSSESFFKNSTESHLSSFIASMHIKYKSS